jgi:hypothetical protein
MTRFAILLAVGIMLALSGCSPKKEDPSQSDAEIAKAPDGPKLKELTVETISQITDEALESIVLENIYATLGEDGMYDHGKVASLTPGQRAFYVTWILEGEVNNGGFNQYYYNTGGQLAGFGAEAFARIGATKFADLVKEAETIYADIKDDLEKNNDGTIEGFSKSYENNPLNDLDTRFFKTYGEEPITKLRVKFVRDNVSQFVGK